MICTVARLNQTAFAGVVALVLLCSASIASAQNDEPAPAGDFLAGPKVEAQAENQPGGMMGDERRAMAGRRQDIPPRQWFAQLRSLELSSPQTESIRAIMDEFAAAQRAFWESLTDEQQEQLRQLNPERRDGMQQPNRQQREFLAQIESQRPQPEPYQRRIWNELTPEQQAEFKSRLDRLREQMIQEREDRRDGREGVRDGNRPAPAPPRPRLDDMVVPPDVPRSDAQRRPQSDRRAGPEPPRRPRDARRGEERDLDRMAQRRLRFLQSRQSASVLPRPPAASSEPAPSTVPRRDGQPRLEDRRFDFEEHPPHPSRDRSPRPPAEPPPQTPRR